MVRDYVSLVIFTYWAFVDGSIRVHRAALAGLCPVHVMLTSWVHTNWLGCSFCDCFLILPNTERWGLTDWSTAIHRVRAAPNEDAMSPGYTGMVLFTIGFAVIYAA